jgi:uncharacterized protein (TIGR03000 family)
MRSFTLAAVTAAMTLAAVAGPAQAQRWRGGGYRGYGYGYPSYGYYGGGYGYYPNYYGYRNYGYTYPSYSYYYPSYGYAYSYPSYAYSYPSYGYTYPSYTYSTPTYNYPSTSSSAYVDPNSTVYSQSNQTSTSLYRGVDGDKVLLHVILPTPDARLTIQDQPMQTGGRDRTFISPAMERGRTYTYTVKATWMDNANKEVIREKKVDVQVGQQYTIDFNMSDATPIGAPAANPNQIYQAPQSDQIPPDKQTQNDNKPPQ